MKKKEYLQTLITKRCPGCDVIELSLADAGSSAIDWDLYQGGDSLAIILDQSTGGDYIYQITDHINLHPDNPLIGKQPVKFFAVNNIYKPALEDDYIKPGIAYKPADNHTGHMSMVVRELLSVEYSEHRLIESGIMVDIALQAAYQEISLYAFTLI